MALQVPARLAGCQPRLVPAARAAWCIMVPLLMAAFDAPSPPSHMRALPFHRSKHKPESERGSERELDRRPSRGDSREHEREPERGRDRQLEREPERERGHERGREHRHRSSHARTRSRSGSHERTGGDERVHKRRREEGAPAREEKGPAAEGVDKEAADKQRKEDEQVGGMHRAHQLQRF